MAGRVITRHEFVKYCVAGKPVHGRPKKGIRALTDRELIRQFKNGTPEEKEKAKIELQRRINRGRLIRVA